MSEAKQADIFLTNPKEIEPQTVWVPEVGWVLLPVKVIGGEYRNIGYDKPYIDVEAEVTDGPHAGFKLHFRAYLHYEAEGWLKYFLKKFGYPNELLDCDRPLVKIEKVVGLSGQVLVLVYEQDELLEFDVKGFGRPIDPQLEQRWAAMKERAKAIEEATEAVDIHADVKEAAKQSESGQVTITDDDLPSNFWPEDEAPTRSAPAPSASPKEMEWPEDEE